jgi:ABC-type dipeptide/oligopeptide/nickel transport system ATPase component
MRKAGWMTIHTSSAAACGNAIAIAMALLTNPSLLIADEPHHALST